MEKKKSELASLFGVRAYPTMIFIPIKENPQVVEGVYLKDDLRKIINHELLKK